MRQLIRFFFLVDVLWWLASAFPGLRPAEAIPGTELLPAFDIAMAITHVALLVVVTVLRRRLGVLMVLTLFWIGMVAHRHYVPPATEELPTLSNARPSRGETMSKGGQRLRILSFNVEQFQDRTDLVRELGHWIKEERIDIVCLQEFGLRPCWPNTLRPARYFADACGLPYYDFTPHPNNIFGTAVFSSLPIGEKDILYQGLPNTNEIKTYEVRLEDRSAILVNVHLESFNLLQRGTADLKSTLRKHRTQADSIVSYLTSQEAEAFICGDLNAVRGMAAYRTLAQGRQDVQRQAGLGLLATHSWYPLRLDHVFCPSSWRVVDARVCAPIPSDHCALLVELMVR